jgi:alanine-synthesizing transaminase
MEFRRIPSLPPYVFAEIDRLKLELRRAGEDVIDLGFGNPDLPSPDIAVEKLREAAENPRNHRYSASRGIPNLRRAVCERYASRYGVELDPETEAIATMGAKEGFCHLFWVLVEPGDAVLVPTPSYPIHLFAPVFAGAAVVRVPVTPPGELLAALVEAYEHAQPKPRAVVLSFPHNPTTGVVDSAFMQAVVDFARERDVLLVHDFAYADLGFDGHSPPSILQAEGAKDVAVELYSLTKGFSLAGWRVGFVLGNAEVVHALGRLKSYLDYGTFQPIQIAAITTLREAAEFPEEVNDVYRSRRDALCDGLGRIGWDVERPLGTMFVWAPIPERFADLTSLEFAVRLARDANVAISPGEGFGPGGERHMRFALVENEQRIRQAVRGIGRALGELG